MMLRYAATGYHWAARPGRSSIIALSHPATTSLWRTRSSEAHQHENDEDESWSSSPTLEHSEARDRTQPQQRPKHHAQQHNHGRPMMHHSQQRHQQQPQHWRDRTEQRHHGQYDRHQQQWSARAPPPQRTSSHPRYDQHSRRSSDQSPYADVTDFFNRRRTSIPPPPPPPPPPMRRPTGHWRNDASIKPPPPVGQSASSRPEPMRRPPSPSPRRQPHPPPAASRYAPPPQHGHAQSSPFDRPWSRSPPPPSSLHNNNNMRPTAAAAPSLSIHNEKPKKKNDGDDMISNLRAAFMNSFVVDRQRRIQERNKKIQAHPAQQNAVKKSIFEQQTWRRGGAKEYRRQQEKLRKEQDLRKERHQSWLNRQEANKSFWETGEMKQQKEQKEKTTTPKQRTTTDNDEDNKRIVLEKTDGDMTVTKLANKLRVSKDVILSTLQGLGEGDVAEKQQEEYHVDIDIAELVALELGFEPVRGTRRKGGLSRNVEDDKNLLLQRRAAATTGAEDITTTEATQVEKGSYESFPPRPPVVCIMGHVDHGKTTLMDALRRRSQSSAKEQKGNKKKKSAKKGKKAAASNEQKGDVAGTEAGGITQVISAFQVALDSQDVDDNNNAAVTFLDTPGHAAFRAMRESGSHAADVIVLVVAADDGVSHQTVEILDFYKSIVKGAGGGAISLVVAMTKIDKPGVDIEESRMRIENQLLEHGIVTENMSAGGSSEGEYGPPVQFVPVSGLTGDGLDDLIEGLVLQSEVMDLRADEEARAEGIVMDARMEKGLGVVADCIVRWGSLERGDVLVSGTHFGKVKALKNVSGKTRNKGMPSQPVRIIGFESLPKAGDPVICVASEEMAKRLIERRESLVATDPTSTYRKSSENGAEFQVTGTASKTTRMTEMAENRYDIDDEYDPDAPIRIPVVIKADADGTLAAVRDSLLEIGYLSSHNINVDPVSMGIGAIMTSDIVLAKQSGASIFTFGLNKLNDQSTLLFAEGEGIKVRNHDVIYSLLDDAKEVFAEYLPPSPVEKVHGTASVQAVFDINNKKNAERIAGLKVLDGTLYRDKTVSSSDDGGRTDVHYRVIRHGERISPEGETVRASSLRKVKEDVDDVRRGEECGLGLDGFSDIQEGDTIECYSMEMQRVFD